MSPRSWLVSFYKKIRGANVIGLIGDLSTALKISVKFVDQLHLYEKIERNFWEYFKRVGKQSRRCYFSWTQGSLYSLFYLVLINSTTSRSQKRREKRRNIVFDESNPRAISLALVILKNNPSSLPSDHSFRFLSLPNIFSIVVELRSSSAWKYLLSRSSVKMHGTYSKRAIIMAKVFSNWTSNRKKPVCSKWPATWP